MKGSKGKIEEITKILFVTESFPPVSYGGGELSCSLLSSALSKRKGFEVTVLTSAAPGLPLCEKRDGVTIVRKLRTGGGRATLKHNLERKLFFRKSVRKELKKMSGDFHIVHFFNNTSMTKVDLPSFSTINSYVSFCPKGNLFYKDERVCHGCSPGKFLGCIIKSEYVGGHRLKPYTKYNPFFWLILYMDFMSRRRTLGKVDHFFSLSEFINERLIDEGVSRGSITKVVNIPDFPADGAAPEISGKGVTIVYIGSLEKIKGVDMLIRAFKRIRSKADLLIVGDGPERKRLEDMAGNNVRFLGRLDHSAIHSVYRRGDIIVVPSRWPEPLSRVLLEAAYFGKPVIANNVGGAPEVIIDGYNGLLSEPEAGSLNQALIRLVNNQRERETMGKNMEDFYRRELSREKVVDKIVGAYLKKLRDGGA